MASSVRLWNDYCNGSEHRTSNTTSTEGNPDARGRLIACGNDYCHLRRQPRPASPTRPMLSKITAPGSGTFTVTAAAAG